MINIIIWKQEVLLDKIMMENPGVPCFLLGHSTGGAVVLKVCNVELDSFVISLFRPDLELTLLLWACEQSDTLTGQRNGAKR